MMPGGKTSFCGLIHKQSRASLDLSPRSDGSVRRVKHRMEGTACGHSARASRCFGGSLRPRPGRNQQQWHNEQPQGLSRQGHSFVAKSVLRISWLSSSANVSRVLFPAQALIVARSKPNVLKWVLYLKAEGTMSKIRAAISLFIACLAFLSAHAEIRYSNAENRWSLVSGKAEYVLHKEKDRITFEYFGPVVHQAWTPARITQNTPVTRRDIDGQVEGEEITPSELKLVSEKNISVKSGVDQLQLVFEHRRLPLRIRLNYTTWGDTGVITRALVVENLGTASLHVQRLPSLSWSLPQGEYDLTYLWGGWSQERQLGNEVLGPGARRFASTRGRATNNYSPWFCLHNQDTGTRYLAQLAYSGNWEMGFGRSPLTEQHPYTEGDLDVDLGMRFDFGGALSLEAGQSFSLPEVAFTSTAGDIDEAANQMHRYQREYAFAHNPVNDPLLVQFNSWYPFQGKMNI